MRIVAGRHRGRTIEAPPGGKIRPTSDRAREALFNILVHRYAGVDGSSPLTDTTVLDVFCGTGAFALEALSRGARHAVLIDLDPAAIACARDNAQRLGENARITVYQLDATNPGRATTSATLAFLDPPYRSGLAAATLSALARGGWLIPRTICVVELDAREDLLAPDGFSLLDERRYGRAKLVFLRYEGG